MLLALVVVDDEDDVQDEEFAFLVAKPGDQSALERTESEYWPCGCHVPTCDASASNTV